MKPLIGINFQGVTISSDTVILLLREIDECVGITSALEGILQDLRVLSHTQNSFTDPLRQRVYHITAGYEKCSNANELGSDLSLRHLSGQIKIYAASQSLVFSQV